MKNITYELITKFSNGEGYIVARKNGRRVKNFQSIRKLYTDKTGDYIKVHGEKIYL